MMLEFYNVLARITLVKSDSGAWQKSAIPGSFPKCNGDLLGPKIHILHRSHEDLITSYYIIKGVITPLDTRGLNSMFVFQKLTACSLYNRRPLQVSSESTHNFLNYANKQTNR